MNPLGLPDSYRTCLNDGTPLIGTFEVAKKEWHCMTCGAYHEFLHTGYRDRTPELDAMYDDHLTRFHTGERGPVVTNIPEPVTVAPMGDGRIYTIKLFRSIEDDSESHGNDLTGIPQVAAELQEAIDVSGLPVGFFKVTEVTDSTWDEWDQITHDPTNTEAP